MSNPDIKYEKRRRRTRPIRYISLFSGVECANLAVRPLGWKPICFSEIEPFPCAVLAHRFPGVPNVGDVTRHDWSRYRGRCDVVIGGSPCQSFSVAGRRRSLADARGNLTLAYVEAVNAIDPYFAAWENVPDILSCINDNAFGRFLAALAGCRSPIVLPQGRKWPGAGMVAGPRRVIAWRILDGQFFGVPQRRRRVFLVACPRASGFDPAEILFEREGLRGDPPQDGKTGQDIAGTFTSRPRSGGWSHDADLAAAGYMQIAKCLTSKNQRIDLETETLVAGTPGGGSGSPIAHTLRGEGFDASEDGTGRGTPLVAFTCKDYGGDAGEASPTLRSLAHDASHANGGGQVAVAYAIQENVINRADTAGAGGKGWFREESPTLGGNGNAHAVAFTQNQAGDVLTGRVCAALGTNQNATGRNTAKVLTSRDEDAPDAQRDGGGKPGASPVGAMSACGGTGNKHGFGWGQQDWENGYCQPAASGVRRLTPRECERLQGIPDDHTLVPYRRKPAADGPRYKAIGNGMAVPCVGWVLRRIHNHFRGGY